MTLKHASLVSIVLAISLILLGGCQQSQKNVDIPRRTAYPRINLYDTVYTALSLPRISLPYNAQTIATVNDADSSMVTVNYPRYRARLLYTFTPLSQQAIDNRTQRIALNIGDLDTEVTQWNNSDLMQCQVYTTLGAPILTPVQWLCVSHDMIVSGAMLLDNLPSNLDSVQPIVDAMRRDVIYSLQHLQ